MVNAIDIEAYLTNPLRKIEVVRSIRRPLVAPYAASVQTALRSNGIAPYQSAKSTTLLVQSRATPGCAFDFADQLGTCLK
eukprot:3307120-Rhodomonas_salina.3